jgi:hypothetical protein
MALDAMAQGLVDETMKLLNEAQFTHEQRIPISPRRMRALILFSQQTIRYQFNGLIHELYEDANAPELAELCAPPTTLAPDELPAAGANEQEQELRTEITKALAAGQYDRASALMKRLAGNE